RSGRTGWRSRGKFAVWPCDLPGRQFRGPDARFLAREGFPLKSAQSDSSEHVRTTPLGLAFRSPRLDLPRSRSVPQRASPPRESGSRCFATAVTDVYCTPAFRTLPCPRKGLSPPDPFVDQDCQRPFFRFATR